MVPDRHTSISYRLGPGIYFSYVATLDKLVQLSVSYTERAYQKSLLAPIFLGISWHLHIFDVYILFLYYSHTN